MSSFWAIILQPGIKYSQYVNESFRITMANLDITCANDKPVQVMMAYEQARFLLCTLHKDKPWQVQLNVLVEKRAVVTLSCNGGSYVHLTGHYRIDLKEPPFNPSWITTLSSHILNEKVNELKNKGTCLEELIEYLNKYTTAKVEKRSWIVTPHIIENKQIQEDRTPLQVPNLKRKSFVKDNNTERTINKRILRSLPQSDENINFNNSFSENCENPSRIPSESSSEDSSMESNNDDDDKKNKSSTYRLRLTKRQKNERKNGNKSEMQKRRKKESEKQEIIKERQAKGRKKAKVIEGKSKKEDADKTKKNGKQQKDIRIIKGGVKVEELQPGTGKIAQVGKYVTICYVAHVKIGRQMTEEFDRLGGLGLRFKLGAGFVIDGLDVGVVGMKIGEKRRLTIPHNMAYGAEEYGPKVPSFSTVIYDVELKKVE